MEFTVDEKLEILNKFIDLHRNDFWWEAGEDLEVNSRDDIIFEVDTHEFIHFVYLEEMDKWIVCGTAFIKKDSISKSEARYYFGLDFHGITTLGDSKEEALGKWLTAESTSFSFEIPSFEEMYLKLAIAGKDVKSKTI